ncbi:hypothetical protein B0H21DRAFT_72726 [Amylocystis lapponica]|nr:hypothetical protein B0H21DRAFT_72726 [Amylocystis lapponica]
MERDTPPKPCVRCGKTHHRPEAFLLECCKCHRTWHHQCHLPPVSEHELVGRMVAERQNRLADGLGAWLCRRCSKNANARMSIPLVSQVPVPNSTGLATERIEAGSSDSARRSSPNSVPKASLSRNNGTAPPERGEKTSKQSTKRHTMDAISPQTTIVPQHPNPALSDSTQGGGGKILTVNKVPAQTIDLVQRTHQNKLKEKEIRTVRPITPLSASHVEEVFPEAADTVTVMTPPPIISASTPISGRPHLNTPSRDGPSWPPSTSSVPDTSSTSRAASSPVRGISAASDIRAFVADMRASGKLVPPPTPMDLVPPLEELPVRGITAKSQDETREAELAEDLEGMHVDPLDIEDLYGPEAVLPAPVPAARSELVFSWQVQRYADVERGERGELDRILVHATQRSRLGGGARKAQAKLLGGKERRKRERTMFSFTAGEWVREKGVRVDADAQ